MSQRLSTSQKFEIFILLLSTAVLTGMVLIHFHSHKKVVYAPAIKKPINTDIQFVEWSGLPVDLRNTLKEISTVMRCGDNGHPIPDLSKSKVIYDYIQNSFALATFGCDVTPAHLFVKTDGVWNDVAQTYSAYFKCSELTNPPIPRKLVIQQAKDMGFPNPISSCFGEDGHTKHPY